jgi:hypothetical protein
MFTQRHWRPLMEYYLVLIGSLLPTDRSHIILKTDAASTTENSVTNCQSTRHHSLEVRTLQLRKYRSEFVTKSFLSLHHVCILYVAFVGCCEDCDKMHSVYYIKRCYSHIYDMMFVTLFSKIKLNYTQPNFQPPLSAIKNSGCAPAMHF